MLPLKVTSETCQNRKHALKIKCTVDIKDDIDVQYARLAVLPSHRFSFRYAFIT